MGKPADRLIGGITHPTWRRRTRFATLRAMPTLSLPSVTDDRFALDVLESDVPVVVDFTAAWCPPCRAMAPVLEELAAERADLRFVQVDVDEQQQSAARYGVLSMPTFIVFRDGAPVLTLVGARSKRRLAQELSAVV
jgi:thioredoxin 1